MVCILSDELVLVMDFSAFNPLSSNSLSLAARNNDVETVARLLRKSNPNCVDNRGWTCLHEAAFNDRLESLLLILKHPDCRPLSETYEGHTALYLACRKHCSIEVIRALLENVDDIANYSSTEMVSPLHVVSSQGRTEAVELLLKHGAMIDVQDFDGDTPLHDAAFAMKHEVVTQLLHAGADADKRNEALYTPLHLACFKGCLQTVMALHSFVCDINQITGNGETPLLLATQNGSIEVVKYLLQNKADPHIANVDSELPLKVALIHGNSEVFKILLPVTDAAQVNKDIMLLACKPHYFNMDIITSLLESDLGPQFFNITEKFHVTLERIGDVRPSYLKNAPLNSFLHICEYVYSQSEELFQRLFALYLLRGVTVDALYIDECPPLVYIHYCEHANCFEKVFNILVEQGCNIDYCSCYSIPDSLIASVATGGSTAANLLQYSLACEPRQLMTFVREAGIIGRIPLNVQSKILSLEDIHSEGLTVEKMPFFVPALKQLCRLQIRSSLRDKGIRTTKQFFKVLNRLPLPPILRVFLRYF